MTCLEVMLLFSTASLCLGGRILLIPLDHSGHTAALLSIGQALKGKGHDVYSLVVESYEKMVEEYKIKPIIHRGPESMYTRHKIKALFTEMMQKGLVDDPKYLNAILETYTQQVISMLENKPLMKEIEDIKFDLAVVDSLLAAHIIPYKFEIPYVSHQIPNLMFPLRIRHPRLPSMVPKSSLPKGYFARIKGRIQQIITEFIGCSNMLYVPPDDLISKYAVNRPIKAIFDIYIDSELFLLNADPNVLDTPNVESTHAKNVGLIGSKPPEPLKGSLEKLVSSGENGVIVISFATYMISVPEYIWEHMFEAFARLSRHVLVRYNGTINTPIPKNVHVLEWMPQNDILGHSNVRLLITHGGHFGQVEAINNGVPMLMSPFGFDQIYNALRAEYRGLGKIFDVRSATPDEIEELIKEMLNNKTFKENIDRLKKIRAALPKAEDNAAFWIDHVVRFGGEHFRPSYLHMPMYEFLCFDILLFFLLFGNCILILICGVCYKAAKVAKFGFKCKEKLE